VSELDAYGRVAAELAVGQYDEGMWLKCLADAEGDENRANAAYSRARAAILRDEAQAQRQGNFQAGPTPSGTPADSLRPVYLERNRTAWISLVAIGACTLTAVISVGLNSRKPLHNTGGTPPQTSTAPTFRYTITSPKGDKTYLVVFDVEPTDEMFESAFDQLQAQNAPVNREYQFINGGVRAKQ
jgi:hypothetical protein